MMNENENEPGEDGGPREMAQAAVAEAITRIEDRREDVADRLSKAADELRGKASGAPGAPAIDRVAKSMESTAGYLHEHETKAIADDVSSYLKLHSMVAIGLAAFVGFLLGRLVK